MSKPCQFQKKSETDMEIALVARIENVRKRLLNAKRTVNLNGPTSLKTRSALGDLVRQTKGLEKFIDSLNAEASRRHNT